MHSARVSQSYLASRREYLDILEPCRKEERGRSSEEKKGGKKRGEGDSKGRKDRPRTARAAYELGGLQAVQITLAISS